jgi:hypothetical protein
MALLLCWLLFLFAANAHRIQRSFLRRHTK